MLFKIVAFEPFLRSFLHVNRSFYCNKNKYFHVSAEKIVKLKLFQLYKLHRFSYVTKLKVRK